MDGTSRRPSRESSHRRLETPYAMEHRSRSRVRDHSRSRLRTRSPCRNRDQELDSSHQRVKLLERQLVQERERLLHAKTYNRSRSRRSARRTSSPHATQHSNRSRSHRSGTLDHQRRRAETNWHGGDGSHAEHRSVIGHLKRSRSPSVSKKYIVDVFKCLKDSLASQPARDTRSFQKIDHLNILPNFDPSTKNQRIDVWLKKVNECASVYSWDDKTIVHFAMQKLQGLAKIWYEGLNSVLFNWQEWQEKLIKAFPCEQNYGQALEEMLKRRSRYNEPIEVYFYEKLALLNQCDIVDKRAVDCIIHGISDRTLKSGALALRSSHPDQLLQFLMSSRDSYQHFDRNHTKNKNDHSNTPNGQPSQRSGAKSGSFHGCYNCRERGHSFLHCPKPLIKCTKCNKVGHTVNSCYSQIENNVVKPSGNIPKAMCIDVASQGRNSHPNSKFMKDVEINGTFQQAFVDFGSEVTLIKESVVNELGLTHDHIPSLLKGFGNGIVESLGGLLLNIGVDGVNAQVPCKVVCDNLLEKSALIGQSYTEQPHIIVYKDVSRLQFINIGNEMPHPDLDLTESSLKIRATGLVELYGAASVKAWIEPSTCGSILLRNVVAGKPNKQYFVCGGLYRCESSRVYVTVFPCSSSCCITNNLVLCRAKRVEIVSRLVVEPPEIPLAIEGEFDENLIRVGDKVPEDVKQRLFELLKKYHRCFASSLRDLGCTNVTEMNIELNSERPVVYRPYRLSHHEREKVRSMVKEMLDAGIVRESTSAYASPILLVRKKDGSFRMCIDYRMLNSITVKERYPMPIIEDEIARLTGQACFISLDLASGYYQLPISEQSRHLTSFVTPDGQYEFNRMPFGLANAPAVFQRMMNSILGSARFNKATAYIDDVLIFGKDFNECLVRLEEVLQVLEKAHLTLNLSKCDFLRDKIDYLGYEISAAGVRPGDKKIISVMNFPRPENVHNIRQFLGLASYFRKFIQDFARIALPLSKLLKKDTAWTWGDSQEEAFEVLKSKLVDRPILAIYNPAAETELHTDASKLGIGGILLQRSEGNDPFRPVAYYSRQTSPEEKNFHSYELETLAVVCSLRKFRVYLLGKSFRIVTDCSALRSTFSKRDLIPRIARWWLLLQEFQCSVEYRAGIKMGHVDALSRNPVQSSGESPDDQFSVMSISSEDWLHTLQIGDTELCRIKNILNDSLNEKELRYIKDNFVVKDNKLFRCIGNDKNNVRWVVPKGARWQVCRMNHDDIGHFGVEKTLERIKKQYWFSKMPKFVKKYVGSCIECAYAKSKTKTQEGLLHPITKIEVPFHTVHVDHLGPFVKSKRGYTYLFVVVEAFTKFCFIKPVRNTNSLNAIKVLEDIFFTFRVPDRLVSDRGTSFTSHAFNRFCLDKGIKHILNTVASPRSNGQVERYNRTILDSLKAMTVKYGEKDWDSHLGKIQWGLNNTVQKTTGRTPSEVLFGASMNSEINPILNEVTGDSRENCEITAIREEVKKKIDNEQVKQKQAYDRDRVPARIYVEGELVKITKTCFNNNGQSKKLMPSFMGPYRVTKVLGRDRYKVAPVPGLASMQNKRPTTVAADRMMPWIHIAALEVNNSDTSCTDDEDQTEQ